MNVEELSQKWSRLKEKRAALVSKQDQIRGRLDAEKEQLKKLIDEIKAKGYDPKNLGAVIQEKEEKLKRDVAEFEARLIDVETKLKSFEV
jgi:2C-methyl-D-erythritol 2,4-cyclodiphosphate synthase